MVVEELSFKEKYPLLFHDNWSTQYGKYAEFSGSPNDPTSLNYAGTCAERIQNMKARGYGQESNFDKVSGTNYWERNCERLIAEKRALQEEEKRKRLEADQAQQKQKEIETTMLINEQSSIPVNNTVSTANLGGDDTHQETDVSTNVDFTPMDIPITSGSGIIVDPIDTPTGLGLGIGAIALGGIALLLLNRGRK
jgi:hypothetical protein